MLKTPLLYVLVCVVTAAALIGFRLAFPDYRFMLMLDYGPLQFAQCGVLTFASYLAVRHLVVAGPAHSMWPGLLALAALALNLAWREAELDQDLFGTRAASWGRLFDSDKPLSYKLGLYLPHLLATMGLSIYLLPHLPDLVQRGWASRNTPAFRLIAGGLGLLVVSQVWDHSKSLEHRFGVFLFADQSLEEIQEMIGDLLFLFGIVEVGKAITPSAPEGSRPPLSNGSRPADGCDLQRAALEDSVAGERR